MIYGNLFYGNGTQEQKAFWTNDEPNHFHVTYLVNLTGQEHSMLLFVETNNLNHFIWTTRIVCYFLQFKLKIHVKSKFTYYIKWAENTILEICKILSYIVS